MAIFKDFSNEYIFDEKSVIRKIKSPMCDKCNSQMVHNGYNEYSKQNLGNLKIGKYQCPNCKSNKEESKSS
ncbi:MAG: hypothetical protein M0P69_09010 [Bacteroidales bacterium]|nr:hypothetical protein [Bacteroidales bacterium]